MRAIVFDLYLCQPVLVAVTEPGDENSAEGMNHIPGSSIRGALIARRLAQQKKSSFDLQQDMQDKDWFFQNLFFLNAYPLHPGGTRMLPTPLSWRVEKEFRQALTATIHDEASGKPDSINTPVTVLEPFSIVTDAGCAQLFSPARSIRIHNSGWKRHTKGEGDSQVFRYEALAAGQTFRAAIVGDSAVAMADEIGLRNGVRIAIGRSRSGDYGQVEVGNRIEVERWEETPPLPVDWKPQTDERLALILTSDAILHDTAGLPTSSLYHEMGIPSLQSWYRMRLSGGFNRAWGMPIPQEIALQAGSVFVYDAMKVDIKKVNALLADGTGLRRLEGYGRIRAVLNPPEEVQREDIPYVIDNIADDRKQEIKNKHTWKIAQRIGQQYLTNLLEEKLSAAVANLTLKGLHDRAQIGRLRLVARHVLDQLVESQATAVTRDDSDQSDLSLFIAHLNDLKSSKDKIHNARLKRTYLHSPDSPRLDDWITKLVSDGKVGKFWQEETEVKSWGWHQFLAPDAKEHEDMIGIEPEKNVLISLQLYFITRLIEGVLSKAAREAQHELREEKDQETSNANN